MSVLGAPAAPEGALRYDGLGRREPIFDIKRHTRDAGALTGDTGWFDVSNSVKSAAGIRISQSTALQVSTVYAAVTMISYDLAKLPAGIFAGTRKGQHARATAHPVDRLLTRPNDWMTWFEFAAMLQMSVLLKGNGYAVILRDGMGNPIQLVPINPDRCQLWEAPNGELFYMVTRTGLHELWVLKDVPYLVPSDDVFHLKAMSANGLVGLSPISLERESIGLALAQEQLASYWAANGARPGGALQTEQKLTDEIRDRALAAWNRTQGGLTNAGRTAILEAGLKWQALSMSSVDMEFLAARQFQVEEIARIFRIPLFMLGTERGGSKSTVAQQAQEYLNYTLRTWIRLWEERFNFTFDLHSSNTYLDFDEEALIEADIATRYAAYRVSTGGQGWRPVNEVRALDGLGPIDGGETLYRPVNMAPLTSDLFEAMPDPGDATLPGDPAAHQPGLGSDQTGQGAEGGGHPPGDGGDASPQAIKQE